MIRLGPSSEPGQEPFADDRPQRDLLACMTGEHGLVWYAVAWVGALAVPALLTAVSLSIVVATGGI